MHYPTFVSKHPNLSNKERLVGIWFVGKNVIDKRSNNEGNHFLSKPRQTDNSIPNEETRQGSEKIRIQIWGLFAELITKLWLALHIYLLKKI
jgi:hypothetical protein